MDTAGRIYRLEHIGRRFRWVHDEIISHEFTTMSGAKGWAVSNGWMVVNRG
jgi:hypothetical protein